MVLILLEALLALTLLVLIVWWTMFSGRRNGEPVDASADDAHIKSALPPPPSAPERENGKSPPPR